MSGDHGEIGEVGTALDAFMDELVVSRAARLEAEGQRRLLKEELNHRVKNLLTLTQAVARQTFATAGASEAVATFNGRLQAMAAANNLLLEEQWQAAPLREIIKTSIAPFRDEKRDQFAVGGPELAISSGAALALGMALHELCTNAAKYSALSVETGLVTISWSLIADTFSLVWSEQGGPSVKPPANAGFVSTVIKQDLEHKIGGDVDLAFQPDGLVCRITAPVEALLAGTAVGPADGLS